MWKMESVIYIFFLNIFANFKMIFVIIYFYYINKK